MKIERLSLGNTLKAALLWALCCVLLCAAALPSRAAEVIRLACVGDSITYGAGVSDRATKAYPVLLGQWMGPNYDVRNFGASGATLLKQGNLPYWNRPKFQQALDFKPDVVVIMLGTNDSKNGSPDDLKIANNWQYKASFVDDYYALIAEFKKVSPNTKIYLCLPVPAFGTKLYGINGTIIANEIVPLVRQIAAQSKSQLIDLFQPLTGKPEMYHDGIHPNDAGTRIMAAEIYHALTGKTAPVETDAALAAPAAPANVAPVNPVPVAPQPDAAKAAPVAAAAAIVTPPAKANFHIYLLMGQSNMVGRDTRTMDTEVNNPRILALNGDGQWVVARDPITPQVGRIAVGVGPGISFAQTMLEADPNATIGLVACAVGNTPLSRWVKGGDLYENAVKRAKIAAPFGTIDGVLWHQGEAETGKKDNAESYEARLAKMFGDLRADLGTPNLPIVVGQLGEFLGLNPTKYPYIQTMYAAIKHMPAAVPNVGYADSAGLTDKGDKLHFNAESQREFGRRYAKAMLQLKQAQTPKP